MENVKESEKVNTMSWNDWIKTGRAFFGKNPDDWKFECVSCGHVQSVSDFVEVGVERDKAVQAVYQECIGRYTKEKGCDWCLFGLFQIHESEVEQKGDKIPVFIFATDKKWRKVE